jgi:hypothetical protein
MEGYLHTHGLTAIFFFVLYVLRTAVNKVAISYSMAQSPDNSPFVEVEKHSQLTDDKSIDKLYI